MAREVFSYIAYAAVSVAYTRRSIVERKLAYIIFNTCVCEIKKQLGIEIDKRKVVMNDIKSFGTQECEVKLYQGITAKLSVVVGE